MPKNIFEMTPAEQADAARHMLMVYEAALQLAPPNLFVYALRHPTRLDHSFAALAYSPSFGFYAGGMMYAFKFVPPLTLNISDVRLRDGAIPVPEMMTYADALREAIEDTRAAIAYLEAQ